MVGDPSAGGARPVRDEVARAGVAETAAAMAFVRGRCVADEDGQPLAACVVRSVGESECTVVSGRDGSFAVPVSVAQAFTVSVTADGRALREGHWAEPLRPGQSEDLGDVRMRRAFAIVGRVVDPSGNGVADTQVVVFGLDAALRPGMLDSGVTSAKTDSTGAFVLDQRLPAGSWRAQVWGPQQRGGGDFVVDPVIGAADLVLVVEPDAIAVIAGVVVDDLGVPVADVILEVMGPSALATTDANGHFELRSRRVQQTQSEIVVRSPGRCDVDPRRHPVQWGDERLRIELRRANELTVEVVDDAGAPVEDFGVWVVRESESVVDEQFVRSRGVHEGGRVIVAPVRRGANMLRVCPQDAGWMASEPQRVDVGDGPQPTVRIVVPRLRVGAVEVVDGAGAPVAGAKVELLGVRGRRGPPFGSASDLRRQAHWHPRSQVPDVIAASVTAVDGTATVLAPAELGGTVLRVDQAAFVVCHQPSPRLAPAQTLRVVLTAAAAIQGTVALHGRAAGAFAVDIADPNGNTVNAVGQPYWRIASDGSFQVDRLAAGVHRLTLRRQVVWRADSEAAMAFVPLPQTACEVAVRTGETAVVELDAGPEASGALQATVHSDAVDLAGWRVDLVFAEGSPARYGAFVLDVDGAFRADDLLPGRYRLQLRAPGAALPVQLRDLVEVRTGAVTSQQFRFVPRRLVLQLRNPDGSAISEPWDLQCGTQTVANRRGAEYALDPAPEVPVQVRRNGADGPWSQPVSMPTDRSELTVEVIVPAPLR